jgi:putative oxidoreductase
MIVIATRRRVHGRESRLPGNDFDMGPVRAAARMMLGGIFVASGARALARPSQLTPQAKRINDVLTPLLAKVDPRIPVDARRLVQLNGAVQLGAGLLLATGRMRRPAAGVLAVFLIPTTIAAHPFWTYPDPEQRHRQQVHFAKNLGVLGGLLLAAADTEGRPSLRWRAVLYGRDRVRSIQRGARTTKRQAQIARWALKAGRHLPG